MMKAPALFPEVDDDFSKQSPTTSDPEPFHNRTLPSRAAAVSARSFVRSQAVRVAEYILSQGEHGATDREIQTALAMDGNSQRPRRVWLRNNGFVQEKGHPNNIVLREGSTVWVSIRPFDLTSTRPRPSVMGAG